MLQLGIIGSSQPDEEVYKIAYIFGEKLGLNFNENDLIIICGGRTGVMEAVCKGVKNTNPSIITVGILPSDDKRDANPYIDIKIATGIGFARNYIIVNSSDLIISIGRGYGTLSEVGFALRLGKVLYGIKTWEVVEKQFDDIDLLIDAIKREM